MTIHLQSSEFRLHSTILYKPKVQFSDLTFVFGNSTIANLQNVGTFCSELRILMYESHPLAQNESLDLSQLGAEDWVEIKAEVHPIYQVIEAFSKKAGFERSGKIVQEVSSLELMCHFVGLKKGIAFVPSFFDTSSFPNVIKKKLQGEQLIFDQCMVFLRGRME